MNAVEELQTWFQTQCNGEWEHAQGITIRSTDNPGWWVTIDLGGTHLEGKSFVPVVCGDCASADPQPPWLCCRVDNSVFHGAGDMGKLEKILSIFLAWAKDV